MQPLSERMLATLKAKNMDKESPILVRVFKEEAELEVWKQDDSGRFALLRTYPICRWSGELGPKFKTGDRQAPEGFYTITPGLMNPDSSQYLAINTGFPNAYDRANSRTGAFLMIHGGCSSAGVSDFGKVTGDLKQHALMGRDLPRPFFTDAFVKVGNRSTQRARNLEQPSGRDAIDAALVFVSLLIRHPDHLGELLLGQAQHDAAFADPASDMIVDCGG